MTRKRQKCLADSENDIYSEDCECDSCYDMRRELMFSRRERAQLHDTWEEYEGWK